MRWTALALAVVPALVGCATVESDPPAPPTPPVVSPPVVAVVSPDLSDPLVSVVPPPVIEGRTDEILNSRWAYHPDIQDRAAYWVGIYAGRDAGGFPTYLERMGAYQALVDSALAAEGLPPSLRYLPIVESGYVAGAVSRASAVGLWQFMAPVARGFGLEVTPLVDERRDPVKSTVTAARYLRELQERFGSWFLALAAYNGGPTRLDRLLREHAPLAPPGDSLFLVVAPHLPRETRDFVPKLLAVAAVAEDPGAYGIAEPDATLPPLAFDEVEVPDATSLDVVARVAGVDETEVRALNPHILRGVTPRGRPTALRLPPGRGEGFAEALAAVPLDERVTVTEHVVRRGETLSGIASRYGVRLSELEAANPNVRPRRLQIGQRLLVPLVPGAAAAAAASTASGGVHVVRSGESLWSIARRYGTTVENLRRLNGLGRRAVLHPGDRLRVG